MKRFHRSGWLMFAALLALGGALWPQAAYAEGCAALDPMPCLDQAIYSLWLAVMKILWLINRTLILIPARWIEGLRTFLMEDVFGSIFDVTLLGIQAPFWTIAAIALCVFAACSFLIGFFQTQWVRPRAVFGYSLLAMLLFSIGSPAIAATEDIRMGIAQGFSQIAQQGVADAGGAINFYVASDGQISSVHSIYDGDADCDGMSTKRAVSGIYFNDYMALYLKATATDIHCPKLSLPVQFKEQYAKEEQIDLETPEKRQEAIGMAQEGATRMFLGLTMWSGVYLEQGLHLIFTVCIATVWFGLLISLLFALFSSTEGMFKSQLHAGVQVFKTSWIASLWIGIALAIVNQAAQTGSGTALYGATVVATLVMWWQIAGAFRLLISTMFTVGDGVSGGGLSALKNLAGGALSIGSAIATGGASALLSSANYAKGAKEEGSETAKKDGTSYGKGVALAGIRPLRKIGQLARATGMVSESNPFYEGLTMPRDDDPFAWSNVQRDQNRGKMPLIKAKQEAAKARQEAKDKADTKREEKKSQPQAPKSRSSRSRLPVAQASPSAKASESLPATTRTTTRLRQPEGVSAQESVTSLGLTTEKAQTASQALSPEIIAMAKDLQAPPQTAREIGRRIGALSLQIGRAEPAERQDLRAEIELLAQQYFNQRGTLPPLDPALPIQVRVSQAGVVRATLAGEHAPQSAGETSNTVAEGHRERVAFGAARPSAGAMGTSGTARATSETGQATGQRGYRTATTADGHSRALVRTGSGGTSQATAEATVIGQSMPSSKTVQTAPSHAAQQAVSASVSTPVASSPQVAPSNQAAPVAQHAASGVQAGAQQPPAAPKVVVSTSASSSTAQPASTPAAQTPISGLRASSQASSGASVASHIDPSTLAAPVELSHSAKSATVADSSTAPAPVQGVEQPAQASTPQESPIGLGASTQPVQPVVTHQTAPQVQHAPAPTQRVEPAPIQPSASHAALPHAPVASQTSSVAPIAQEPMVFEPNQQPAEQGAEQPTEQPSRRSKPWARHAQQRQVDQPQQTVEHKQSRAALPRASDRRKS